MFCEKTQQKSCTQELQFRTPPARPPVPCSASQGGPARLGHRLPQSSKNPFLQIRASTQSLLYRFRRIRADVKQQTRTTPLSRSLSHPSGCRRRGHPTRRFYLFLSACVDTSSRSSAATETMSRRAPLAVTPIPPTRCPSFGHTFLQAFPGTTTAGLLLCLLPSPPLGTAASGPLRRPPKLKL